MSLSSSESKQFVGRYLQALSGQAKTPELVARFVSDAGLVEHICQIEAAFPAYEIIGEELIAERDLVAVRALFQGVQRGPFAGIPATGRAVSVPFMIIYRVSNDRIVEHWMQFDGAALIAQLQEAAATV
jgi:predicted ester cyclase